MIVVEMKSDFKSHFAAMTQPRGCKLAQNLG